MKKESRGASSIVNLRKPAAQGVYVLVEPHKLNQQSNEQTIERKCKTIMNVQ